MISFANYKGPVDVEDPAGTIPRSLEGYVPNHHSLWRFAWRRPGPHGILVAPTWPSWHPLRPRPRSRCSARPTRTAPPAFKGTQACARGRSGGTRGCCGDRGTVGHKRWKSSGLSDMEIISCT